MKHRLVYTRQVVKDIRKLDIITLKKLKAKLESYSQDPKNYAKKLINSKIGKYRWRIGKNYRVIFDLDKKNIVILRIRHRKEVYKR
ncbi:MAG: type II toxin-antitoxin system RelE/ParE family toxin [Patescibacteria group bacterium]